MIISVSGSRGISTIPKEFKEILLGATKVIHGGALGFDQAVHKFCVEHKIKTLTIKPNYNVPNPKYAPLLRNKTIVKKSDFLLVCWDGKSKGTKFTYDYAVSLNKRTYLLINKNV